MNTLQHLLDNLLTYSTNSYVVFSDDSKLDQLIYKESKKYTDNILLLDKNTNKDAIYKAQLFFKTVSVLPKITIFSFPQTEFTINASLKMIEELLSNQYIFIVTNNHRLPITLLSRCLQIHNYSFDEKKYKIFIEGVVNKTFSIKEYDTHLLYDFLKHLCNKYIRFRYNADAELKLNMQELKLYSDEVNYMDVFQNINYKYKMYVSNNLNSDSINQAMLSYIK